MNWILSNYHFLSRSPWNQGVLSSHSWIDQEKSGSEQIFKCYTIEKNAWLVYLPKLLKAAVFHTHVLLPLTRNSSPFSKSKNTPISEHPSVLQMETYYITF